jgi:RHS repeat-associated protein
VDADEEYCRLSSKSFLFYVDTLIQDFGSASLGSPFVNMMNNNGIHNRFKKIVYQYDLISGKVNHVAYQPQYIKSGYLYRPADAMYHKYEYDAENRITAVFTSTDSLIWEKDAAYDYYKHGPLARTILGDQQVQGLDYAYTIQGWLKGVNSSSLSPDKDMGLDGLTTNASTRYIARDALGFSLNYFNGDYQSISAGAGTNSMPLHTAASGITNGLSSAAYRPLYNGNISSMVVNIGALSIPDVTGSGTTNGAILYNYKYDQLNRLKAMDAYKGLTAANNSWANIIALRNYRERISYDGNGNILTYSRYGNNNSQQLMDSLDYSYNYLSSGMLAGKLSNNRLRRVRDFMTNAAAYDESDPTTGVSDLEDQTNADNYTYDAIGNLKSDAKENISLINWNVYGKITDINFGFVANKNKTIYYLYDAAGNRIGKQVEKCGATSEATTSSTYTWYVRDASGNVMATYSSSAAGSAFPATLTLGERHLYGSSRLGILAQQADSKTLPFSAAGTIYSSNFIRGNKFFELSNHLGNVLVTISDKKIGVNDGTYDAGGVKLNSTPDDKIDFYTADVVTANDYYPFGMAMPGRKFATTNQYRYGFNGKEKDNEASGDGNQYDYGFRIYNPGLGKFLSVDPLTNSYPWYSPFHFAGNNPIHNIDLDGLEETSYGQRLENQWIPQLSKGKITKEQYEKRQKATAIGGVVGVGLGLVAIDAFYNKGMVTNFVFTSIILGHFYHNGTKDPVEQKKRESDLKNDLIGYAGMYVFGKIVGTSLSVIKGPAIEEVKYLFRGTSEGFAGSKAVQAAGMTPTSSDPAVATLFSMVASKNGNGILQIALPEKLGNVVVYQKS